jgi:hypothetical protein
MVRKLRTVSATVAAALTLMVGASVVTAAPAQAAESATFSFVFDTGALYANQPVQLYRANGTRVKDGKTGSNRCAVFTGLTPSRSYQVRAYAALGSPYARWRIYDGWTPYQTGFGYGRVSLGTGVSSYRGCQPSIYGTCW